MKKIKKYQYFGKLILTKLPQQSTRLPSDTFSYSFYFFDFDTTWSCIKVTITNPSNPSKRISLLTKYSIDIPKTLPSTTAIKMLTIGCSRV